MRLHWRWLRDGREIAVAGRSVRVRAEVFPGQPYAFALQVPTPREPGTYALELGLASEGVMSFVQAGSPPLRLRVEVRHAGGLTADDPRREARSAYAGDIRSD